MQPEAEKKAEDIGQAIPSQVSRAGQAAYGECACAACEQRRLADVQAHVVHACVRCRQGCMQRAPAGKPPLDICAHVCPCIMCIVAARLRCRPSLGVAGARTPCA